MSWLCLVAHRCRNPTTTAYPGISSPIIRKFRPLHYLLIASRPFSTLLWRRPNVRCMSPRLSNCIGRQNKANLETLQTARDDLLRENFDDMSTQKECRFRALRDCGSAAQRDFIGAQESWLLRPCLLSSPVPGTSSSPLPGPSRPQHDESFQLPLAPPSGPKSPSVRTRTCLAGNNGAYDGPLLTCEPLFCPAWNFSALALGVCADCSGLDAILSVPRTRAPTDSSAVNDESHVASAVTVSCPPSHTGQLIFTCSSMGLWHFAQFRGGQQHGCRRKHCERMEVDLTDMAWGWMSTLLNSSSNHTNSYRQLVSPRWLAKQKELAVAVFDSAVEGTIASVSCATSSTIYGSTSRPASTSSLQPPLTELGMRFNGSLWQECPYNHNSWTQLRGQCLPVMCPSGVQQIAHKLTTRQWQWYGHTITVADSISLPMRFPWQFSDLGLSVYGEGFHSPTLDFPCCPEVTKAGGCANTDFGFGHFFAKCQAQRWSTQGTHYCLPQTKVQFRLDSVNASVVNRKSKRWYNLLRDSFGDMTAGFTKMSERALTPNGFVTTVSVSVAGSEWRNIHAAARFNANYPAVDQSYTIDASPPKASHLKHPGRQPKARDEETATGRGVAAFATVACRQHGFGHAALVSSCGALKDLMEEIQDDGSCKSGFERNRCGLSSHDDTLWRPHPVNLTQLQGLLTELCGPPVDKDCKTWLTVSPDADYPSAWMSPSLGEPGTEGASWAWALQDDPNLNVYSDPVTDLQFRDGVAPTARRFRFPFQPFSACVGDEQSLVQCFRNPLMDGVDQSGRHSRVLQSPCKNKLVVACTDKPQDLDGPDNGYGHPATWVIGDRAVPAGQWAEYQEPDQSDSHVKAISRTGAQLALTQPKLFYNTLPRRCELPRNMAQQWNAVDAAKVNCTWGEMIDVPW